MATIEYRSSQTDILSRELESQYQHPAYLGLVGFGLCEDAMVIEEHERAGAVVTTLAIPGRGRIYVAPPLGPDGIAHSIDVINEIADKNRGTPLKIIAKDHIIDDLWRIRNEARVLLGEYQAPEGRVTRSLTQFDPELNGPDYGQARRRLRRADEQGLQFGPIELPAETYTHLNSYALPHILQQEDVPQNPDDDRYRTELLLESLRQTGQGELAHLIESWALRKQLRNYPDLPVGEIYETDPFKLRELIPMLALAWKDTLPGVEAYGVRDRDNELVGAGLVFTSSAYAYQETKATNPDTQAGIFLDYHLNRMLRDRGVKQLGQGAVIGHQGPHWSGLLRYKELLGRFNPDAETFVVRFVVDEQYEAEPDPEIFGQ